MLHTHQTYLALIVLLMLSEDDFFKKVIHEMVGHIDHFNISLLFFLNLFQTVRNIDWYQPDRAPLTEITLGGLIVLVFAKTIQINTIRIRVPSPTNLHFIFKFPMVQDRYFHMNSLATLANLASCFKQLSPLVSQKLIGLLEVQFVFF